MLMGYINLEYHPNDSRLKIADDEICQTLTTRMGTGGGGNIPIVLCTGIAENGAEDINGEEVLQVGRG
jgi:hypothetical protein